MNQKFKIVAWVAILAACLEIPSLTVSFARGYLMASENPLASTFNFIHYGIILPMLTLCIITIAIGYFFLAKKTDNKLLRSSSIAAIMWYGIYFFWDAILSAKFAWANSFTGALIASFVSGSIAIALGISILKLKKSFSITKTIGILHIINGCMMLTVILTLVSPLLLTALHIIEAILFFKAASVE